MPCHKICSKGQYYLSKLYTYALRKVVGVSHHFFIWFSCFSFSFIDPDEFSLFSMLITYYCLLNFSTAFYSFIQTVSLLFIIPARSCTSTFYLETVIVESNFVFYICKLRNVLSVSVCNISLGLSVCLSLSYMYPHPLVRARRNGLTKKIVHSIYPQQLSFFIPAGQLQPKLS